MEDDPLKIAREAVALAEKATPGPRQIARYGHGGGRVCGGEQDPARGELKGRTLIADLYQEGDRELVWHALEHYVTVASALLSADAALAAKDARITALEGLLREISNADTRTDGGEIIVLAELEARLDAALTPDRKDQDGR